MISSDETTSKQKQKQKLKQKLKLKLKSTQNLIVFFNSDELIGVSSDISDINIKKYHFMFLL